jgi:hypothetical protein
MDHVWVVTYGIELTYEEIVGVFASKESAVEAAMKHDTVKSVKYVKHSQNCSEYYIEWNEPRYNENGMARADGAYSFLCATRHEVKQ